MDIQAQDIESLLLAAVLGAIIGIDREYRGKAAGLRTLMLVSMGAALFTIVSFKMAETDAVGNSDRTRIASNIVVGIGFLGAGIIFRTGRDIKGLTTAATVWLAAAIGIASGIGDLGLAIVSTFIAWIILFFLHYMELLFDNFSRTERYILTWHFDEGREINYREFFAGRSFKLEEKKLSKKDNFIVAEWTIRASIKTHKAFVRAVIDDKRIISLEH